MKDIKEVKQELDYFINMDLCAYCEYEGACDLSIGVCGKRQAKNALKRFINDTENLIKENEELKKELNDSHFNSNGLYVGFDDNSLHNSQVIEPSVLEKIDKLEKENEQYRNSNKQVYEELKTTINQLAITDKALDKACNFISLVFGEFSVKTTDEKTKEEVINIGLQTKEDWKKQFIKESEKE